MDKITEEDERESLPASSRGHSNRPPSAVRNESKRRHTHLKSSTKNDKSHRKSHTPETKSDLPKVSRIQDDSRKTTSNSSLSIRNKPASSFVTENVVVVHKKNRHSFKPGGRPGTAPFPVKKFGAKPNQLLKPNPPTTPSSSRESSKQHNRSSRSRASKNGRRSHAPSEMGESNHRHSSKSDKKKASSSKPEEAKSTSSYQGSRSHSRKPSSSRHHSNDKRRTHSSSALDDKKHKRASSRQKSGAKHEKNSSPSHKSRSHHSSSVKPPVLRVTTSSVRSTPAGSHSEYDTDSTAGVRHSNQHVAAGKKSKTRSSKPNANPSIGGTSTDEMLIMTDRTGSTAGDSKDEKKRKKRLTKSASASDAKHAAKHVRSSQLNKKQSLSPYDNVIEQHHQQHHPSTVRVSITPSMSSITNPDDDDDDGGGGKSDPSRKTSKVSKIKSKLNARRGSSMEGTNDDDDETNSRRNSKNKRSKSRKDITTQRSSTGDNGEKRRSSLKTASTFISHRLSGRRTTTEDDVNDEEDNDDSVKRVKRKKRSHQRIENEKVVTPELAAYLLQTLHSGLSNLKTRANTPSLDTLVTNLVDGLHSASRSAGLTELEALPASDTTAATPKSFELSERAARYEQKARDYRSVVQRAHQLVREQLQPAPNVRSSFDPNTKSTQRPSTPFQDGGRMSQQRNSSSVDDTILIRAFEHDLSLLINARNCEIASLRQQLERSLPAQLQRRGTTNQYEMECGAVSQQQTYNSKPLASLPDEIDVANASVVEAKIAELTRECSDKCLEVDHYQKLATTWRAQLDKQSEKLRDVEALQTKLKSKDYEVERLRMQLESLERSSSRLLTTSNPSGENGANVCRLLADAKTCSPGPLGGMKKTVSVDDFNGSSREADVKAAVRLGEAKRKIKQLQSEIATLDAARRLYEKRCNEMVEQVAASRSQTSQTALQLETAKQTVAEVRLENKRLITLGAEQQKKFTQDLQVLRTEYKRMKAQYHTLELEHGQNAEEARQKHERLHDAQVELKQLEAQLRSLNQELNAVSAEADKRKRIADELKQQLQTLDERLIERDAVSSQLRDQLRAVEADLWQHRQQRDQIEQTTEEQSLERKRTQQLIQEQQAELDKKRQELTFMESQAQDYKGQLDELEGCIKTQFDELLASSQRQIKQAAIDSKRYERKGNCLERALNVVVNFILSGTMQRRITLQRPPIRKLLSAPAEPFGAAVPATSTEPLSDERIARALGVNVQQLHEAARVSPNVRAKLAAMILSSPNNTIHNFATQQQQFDPNWPPQFAANDIEQCRKSVQHILSCVSAEKTNNVEVDELGDTLSRFVIQLVEASVLSNVPLPTVISSNSGSNQMQSLAVPNGRQQSVAQQSPNRQRTASNFDNFANDRPIAADAAAISDSNRWPSANGYDFFAEQQKLSIANIQMPVTAYTQRQQSQNNPSQRGRRPTRSADGNNGEMVILSSSTFDETASNKPADYKYYSTPQPTLLDVMINNGNQYEPTSQGYKEQPMQQNEDDEIDGVLLGQLATAMLATPQHPTSSGTCIWGGRFSGTRQELQEQRQQKQEPENQTPGLFVPFVRESRQMMGAAENSGGSKVGENVRVSAQQYAASQVVPPAPAVGRMPSYEQHRSTGGSFASGSRPSAALGNTAPLQNYHLPCAFSRKSVAIRKDSALFSARQSASDTGMSESGNKRISK